MAVVAVQAAGNPGLCINAWTSGSLTYVSLTSLPLVEEKQTLVVLFCTIKTVNIQWVFFEFLDPNSNQVFGLTRPKFQANSAIFLV